MAKDAIVSDELAKKFATEKDTPYTRWVRGEGLDIISALYVPNLRTVELKPWARRGGARRLHQPRRLAHLERLLRLRDPAGQEARAAAPAVRGDDPGPRRPRLHRGVERRRPAHHLRVEGGRACSPSRSTPGTSTSTARASEPARYVAVTNAPPVINLYDDIDFVFNTRVRLQEPLRRRARLFRRQGRAEGLPARHQLRGRRGQPAADHAPRSAAPAAATSASTWPRAR